MLAIVSGSLLFSGCIFSTDGVKIGETGKMSGGVTIDGKYGTIEINTTSAGDIAMVYGPPVKVDKLRDMVDVLEIWRYNDTNLLIRNGIVEEVRQK